MSELREPHLDGRSKVTIPSELYEAIRDRVDRTGFADPDAYVAFVLEEVLANLERPDYEPDRRSSSEVERRLRALGYA